MTKLISTQPISRADVFGLFRLHTYLHISRLIIMPGITINFEYLMANWNPSDSKPTWFNSKYGFGHRNFTTIIILLSLSPPNPAGYFSAQLLWMPRLATLLGELVTVTENVPYRKSGGFPLVYLFLWPHTVVIGNPEHDLTSCRVIDLCSSPCILSLTYYLYLPPHNKQLTV